MGRFDRLREEKEKLEAYKMKKTLPVKKSVEKQQTALTEKSASLIAEALRLMMKEG
jgi:hypothetical protein